jgi:DnaJ-class molecular chaperone
MQNQTVSCDNCSGKGFKVNQFNGNEDDCRVCEGSGRVIPCDNFSSNKPAVFRNRKCNGCHATEEQHKTMVDA